MVQDKIQILMVKLILIAIVFLVIAIIYTRLRKKVGGIQGDRVNTGLSGSGLIKAENPKGFIFGKIGRKKVALENNKEGHISIFGGSGKGKTSALLIPSLSAWDGPFFAIDISGDISRNVPAGEKERVIISPDNPDESYTVDVFRGIDALRDENEKRTKLEELVNLIVDVPPTAKDADKYYLETARKIFLAAIIGFYDVGMDFIDICKQIFFNDVTQIAKLLEATENALAIAYIKPLLEENEKNVSGAKSALNGKIKLFADNIKMEKILRRPIIDFDGRIEPKSFYPALLEESQVFLKVPDKKQEYYSIFMHIVTGQIVDYISGRNFDPRRDKRILVALDEFASIGHLEVLSPFRKWRKNGANLCILTQSLADIDLIYSENERKVILDNSQYIVVLSANDNSTREYFSNMIGKETVKKESVSSSKQGKSVNKSEQREFAVNPEAWRSYEKHLIVIHPSGYIKLKKNFYFKD